MMRKTFIALALGGMLTHGAALAQDTSGAVSISLTTVTNGVFDVYVRPVSNVVYVAVSNGLSRPIAFFPECRVVEAKITNAWVEVEPCATWYCLSGVRPNVLSPGEVLTVTVIPRHEGSWRVGVRYVELGIIDEWKDHFEDDGRMAEEAWSPAFPQSKRTGNRTKQSTRTKK